MLMEYKVTTVKNELYFGPRMAERAFDAKTGEFLWLS